ncbi:lamin tail domain-containing protein [Paludibaculum fermentans]|uniref:Lamin tail domain-containing protein n=1 Tax=Paludibaculum fermentans TaxID=1473598 RepID=A0A7S7SND8_PALFE|nr:lamin tail domain-containing protein [Paludibaculum fermentans]QOY90010.1 lamin tail domain-containing protein [Paludibaculum fermentans]
MSSLKTASSLLLLSFLAASAHAQVVISQVYGGGGNSGAPLNSDYVELFNPGSSTVPLDGLSLQYTSATGTGNFGATSGQITLLSGSLNAGQYFLVKMSSGTTGADLPAPDLTGTINLSATGGKVALVSGTAALDCNGGSAACSAASVARILDLVGFGTANYYEGAGPAPAASNTTALFRAGAGCVDTNNNAADFSTGAPAPRNAASPTQLCGVSTPVRILTDAVLPEATVGAAYSQQLAAAGGSGAYTWSALSGLPSVGLSLTASGLISGTPTGAATLNISVRATDAADPANSSDGTFTLTVNSNIPTCSLTHEIWQIQGSTATSPVTGRNVVTRGVVTGLRTNGFFVQSPAPGDNNPATSDGVFVFTSSAPPSAAAIGNDVCVSGQVQEYVPSSDPSSPSMTEIAGSPKVTLMGAGTVPPAVTITAADTLVNSLDNLEKYEGMRVRIDSLTAVSPTQGSVNEAAATSTSNGVFYGVLAGVKRPFREAGVQVPDPLPAGSPCCVPRFDGNPERIRIDSGAQPGAALLEVTSGATIAGLVGVLDYGLRTYTLLPEAGVNAAVSGVAAAVPVPDPAADEFTVGGLNVERFFDTVNDPSVSDVALTQAAFNNRLNKLSLLVRNVMKSPDVLGVAEMENLSTLQSVAAKVNADAVAQGQANPGYQAYLVEGNDVGGIDVGFLVKSTKVAVVDVVQYGKDTTYQDPGSSTPALLNDRPPLVLRVRVNKAGSSTALPVTIIANHLRSLTGVDDPADGGRIRAKRRAQAEYLSGLVQSRQQANPGELILLLGDFNAFSASDGYVDVIGTIKGTPAPLSQVVLASPDLLNPDLFELEDTLPAEGRYSYSFDGNAQSLDHMLANGHLMQRLTRFAVAHVDADFPESYRNDPNRPERLSDHDGEVAYLRLPDTVDVTAQCSLAATRLNFGTVDRVATGAVRVLNNGTAPIAGPVYLQFTNLPPGVTLLNADGLIAGSPYLVVSRNALAAGTPVSVRVRFGNTGPYAISYTPKVVTGSF